MKIYLISLERDTGRREKLNNRFPCNSENFTWIRALDAENLNEEDSIRNQIHSHQLQQKSALTKGEKCCAISHTKCLEQFLMTGDPVCIIIEDDIEGDDQDFSEAIKKAETLKDSTLIILGGQQGLRNSKHLSGKKISKNLWKIPKISMPFITRACCYAISRDAAIKIMASQSKTLHRSDDWGHHTTSGIEIYYSNIFKHPANLSESHIEPQRSRKGFLSKVIEDGILKSATRIISKPMLAIKIKAGTYERVAIK